MWKDVANAMLTQGERHRTDGGRIAKTAGISFVTKKPIVVTQPAMLHPYAVGPAIMAAVSNFLTRCPQMISQFESGENCEEQDQRAPRRTLQRLPCGPGLR